MIAAPPCAVAVRRYVGPHPNALAARDTEKAQFLCGNRAAALARMREIVELREAGNTFVAIAKIYGVSVTVVRGSYLRGLRHRQRAEAKKRLAASCFHSTRANLGRPIDMGGDRAEQTWTPEMQWREIENQRLPAREASATAESGRKPSASGRP